MFWKNAKGFSLRFRVNLLVSGLFILSSLFVFVAVDFTLERELIRRQDEGLLDDSVEFTGHFNSLGQASLLDELQREYQTTDKEKDLYALLDREGQVRFKAGPPIPKRIFLFLAKRVQNGNVPAYTTVRLENGSSLRLLAAEFPGDHVLVLGRNMAPLISLIKRYREIFSQTAILVLFLALLMGWGVSNRVVRGIRRVADGARAIRDGRFDYRVSPSKDGTELTELSESFNDMADRIQALLHELETVSGNVAHDLKSPLTRIRGVAEGAVLQNPELEKWAGPIVEESDRLIGMIETMLNIARMNAGLMEIEKKPVNFKHLLGAAVDLFAPVAEEKGVALHLKLPDSSVVAPGDERRLQRMTANLIDNALKFTDSGGKVQVSLEISPNKILLKVEDSGIGISDAEKQLVFQRFHRGEQSRSTSGSGLGLTLARAIAESHGGTISVSDSFLGGSCFTVSLWL
ncbi:MAG: HAMP domain-containing histidine kinase [Acidobacteria bacterium]|nr:HAMP domain-containing histidine kinase [Acidobacteriota bacterium]